MDTTKYPNVDIKKAVLISCNEKYLARAIVGLYNFVRYNSDYDKYIIGTKFSESNHELAQKYDVNLLEIDIRDDFPKFNERPQGRHYPIEMYYHFYAYKLLLDYDFIVNIEPDMYINRKLDIDWNSIKYVAGAGCKYKGHMGYVGINVNKIKEIYDIPKNIHRILGGVRIYCPKNLLKISFYEHIIEYYCKSWELGDPRCGDDSLMVMYQLINPDHVAVLPSEYNVIANKNISLDRVEEIVIYHFISSNKPWITNAKVSEITRYFQGKYLQFLYNNFDLDFIRCYYHTRYVNIENTKIKVYYYNNVNNFGDLFTPYFLKRFCSKDDYEFNFGNKQPKIISCGSIMRLCNKNTIVYGSGIRDIDQKIYPGNIQIVRGPLTRKRLLEIGCSCPPIYGDPGLIFPQYYSPDIPKTCRLGIIPHHTHYKKINKLYQNNTNVKVINLLTSNIERTIDEILSCECTISSSLHGLIISDAYNIPNKWVQYDDNICGDNTKYYDYFASVSRQDQEFIDCRKYKFLDVEDIIERILPVSIKFDVQRLQDNMFFDERGIRNYTKYLYQKLLD